MLDIFKRHRFEPGNWVISDTHWFHKNIIEYNERPFENWEDMNEKMIEAWNNKVGKKDLVYHLGDLAMGNGMGPNHEHLVKLLNRLNGRIVLIVGNHDRPLKDHVFNRFAHVCHYLECTTPEKNERGADTLCIMSHYAKRVWNKSHRGSWMLYGHSHNSLYDMGGKTLDVGVDATEDYAPIAYEEIVSRMSTRFHTPVDHHK